MTPPEQDLQALPCATCPLCGGPNGCAPAASGDLTTPCWCRDVRIDAQTLQRIPADQRMQACICRACASAAPSSTA